MVSKETNMELRSDADLQAIQTSVAFKNISDAIEQYRRQFGLAFLALVAFSAIHVGLVVIANLYTMQTKLHAGVMTDANDPSVPVSTGLSQQAFDLHFIMTNMEDSAQLRALSEVRSASFVDRQGTFRSYTVTGFQVGGWKRSELKLYTSVGHVLQYTRGKGVQVFSETGSTASPSCNCTADHQSRRHLLKSGSVETVETVETGWAKFNTDMLNVAPMADAMGAAAEKEATNMYNSGYSQTSGELDENWKEVIFDEGLTPYFGTKSDSVSIPEFESPPFEAPTTERLSGTEYSAFLKEHGMYDGSGYEEYETSIRYIGDANKNGSSYDELVLRESLMVIVSLTISGNVWSESWENFSTKGYYALDSFSTTSATAGMYGCTASTISDLRALDSQLTDDGAGVGDLFCASDSNAIGGFFFSDVLGAHDSFVAHVARSLLCADEGGLKDLTSGATGVWYLYFMHGWGESTFILFEYEPIISAITATDEYTVGNMITVVVDDSACPYGGKTWYVNNVFSGYHMDLICFDLPQYLETSVGMASLGKGLFGFSMGGFGAISIAITYPTLFLGVALFNSVLDADTCMWYGYCHTYCGVDALLCDIKWTTTHVAFVPYIVVASGKHLSSTGSYDPVSYGIAVTVMAEGSAACGVGGIISTVSRTGLTDMQYNSDGTVKYGFVESPREVLEIATAASDSMFAEISLSTFTAFSTDGYYYLDAVTYTKATSSFSPSFNPATGAIQQTTWNHFIELQPAHRLKTSGQNSLDYSPLVILVSCDSDDPYDLPAQATDLADMYTSGTLSLNQDSGFVMENSYSGACGHCMNLRDFYVAYLWFADAFETWTDCALAGTARDSCFTGGAYVTSRHLLAGFTRAHSKINLTPIGEGRTSSFLTTGSMETTSYTSVGVTVASSNARFATASSFFAGGSGAVEAVVTAIATATTCVEGKPGCGEDSVMAAKPSTKLEYADM